MLRKIVVGVMTGVAAAVVVGVLLGAVSRGMMALVAIAAGDTTQFSWGGTAGILTVYVVAVLPGALLAAATSRRWRWVLPVAGAVFLCVPAVAIGSEEIGHTAGLSMLQWAAVVATGLGVFATIAALPAVTVRVVDRLLRRGAPLSI